MIQVIKSNNDLCVGCNRCVRKCPLDMANITFQDENGDLKVEIDHTKCITCGRCISACKHDARYFEDDTERFFNDLKKGVPISLIAAPSIRTNIPDYQRLFTYLKQQGVKKIYDVSLGADICIWGYIKYLEKTDYAPLITQPCPVIVLYCEIYHPDLLPRLSPVQSPMACTSIYMKKYKGIQDNIAALSPCIAKSNEFHSTGLAQYNITFYKLLEYLWANDITLPKEETTFDHNESGLGSLFPVPGGLKENIEYYAGRKLHIAQGEGFNIYEKLNKYAETDTAFIPDIYDVLNCIEGCTIGPASIQEQNVFEISKKMDKARKKAMEVKIREYYDSIFETYENTLELSHFLRVYKPADVQFPQVTESDIHKAYELLGKNDYKKQNVDCNACGSETCHDMAKRIALHVNIPINCIVKTMDDARKEHENYIIAHEQMVEAADIAKDASNTKTAFLANMSHEIRTPMNAIIGMLELLKHEDLNHRQLDYIKGVSQSAHSLLGIINDILDMSKIEAGKLELNPVDYNPTQLVDNIHSLFSFIARDKGIEFNLEKTDNLPDCLYGDDLRLRQALTNICGNAVKFTENGSVTLSVRTDANKIIFTIKDTGIGIRKEDVPKLFNQFEQVDTYKNRGIVGTGLGLSISKSFVEMMGGRIAVESEYGKGTAFSIILPVIEGNAENINKGEIINAERSVSAPDAKVLVTDDNMFNLKVAVGLLGLMDVQADTAESGYKAIEMVKQTDYDIVFMDHMMPRMDGVETTLRLRGAGYALPIIALTANAVSGIKDMFFENGFNDFIAKPVNVNELHEIVVKHLPPEKVFFSNTSDTQQDRSAKEDELFHKASVTFVKDNRETFINITGSLHSGDIKTAHRIAHTLKSSAGYLGKKALAEAALSLEDSLSSEPPVYTSEQLSTLENELNNALREFEPLLAEAEANKPKAAAVGKDKLAAILEGLRPLLENGDFSAANYVDELQCIAGMEKLAELIDDYDFEAALALLATLPDVCGCKDSTP